MRNVVAAFFVSLSMVACAGTPADEPADDDSAAVQAAPTYVALGDSVPFGEDPTAAARGRFVGYPTDVAKARGLALVNLACPGETSGSLVLADSPDNGCREKWKKPRRLHERYDDVQIGAALRSMRETTPKLVTLQVGANDLLMLRARCASATVSLACEATGILGALNEMERGIGAILKEVRTGAGYTGPLTLVGYYPINTAAFDRWVIARLAARMQSQATLWNASFADPGPLFDAAARDFGGDACKAGLLIPLPDGKCDKHPSAKGRALIARAVQEAAPATPPVPVDEASTMPPLMGP